MQVKQTGMLLYKYEVEWAVSKVTDYQLDDKGSDPDRAKNWSFCCHV